MSIENALWGAPRIHGELLKLGFEVAQSTVAKYMVKRCGPSSQQWRTFLRNHALDIAAMDLFIAPTLGFDLLYGLVIVRLDRRDLVWVNVTTNPTYGPNVPAVFGDSPNLLTVFSRAGIRRRFRSVSRVDFLVNLGTARTLGITISPALVARADEVIE
jgi:hypothetical protein